MNTFIDVHVLQSLPPSNVNRDDTGSPKTAIFGGATRARISSQALKRAVRVDFNGRLDPKQLGYRTTRLVELISTELANRDESLDEATRERLAVAVLRALDINTKAARPSKKAPEAVLPPRTEYLIFLSAVQIENLAQVAITAHHEAGGKIDKREAKRAATEQHSIDIALFGRMVADDATLNVDAAVQVAHAMSTHTVDAEFDYYTAVDDKNPREDTGAGMIGTVEFNSATYYRYATVNVEGLQRNLGDAVATTEAVKAFVRSFITAMPTGKQNTFANRTLPDVVVVMVREDQPVNLAGAFETPVRRSDGGWMASSARGLATYARGVDETFGLSPAKCLVVATPAFSGDVEGLGETVTMPELVDACGDSVAHLLGE